MSKKRIPDGDAVHLSVKLPKSFLWMLLGAVLGNVDEAGLVLQFLTRTLGH